LETKIKKKMDKIRKGKSIFREREGKMERERERAREKKWRMVQEKETGGERKIGKLKRKILRMVQQRWECRREMAGMGGWDSVLER
jgi:hypothetical protein